MKFLNHFIGAGSNRPYLSFYLPEHKTDITITIDDDGKVWQVFDISGGPEARIDIAVMGGIQPCPVMWMCERMWGNISEYEKEDFLGIYKTYKRSHPTHVKEN